MLITKFICSFSPETAQELQDKVEEQRAFTTLGRTHLLHAESLGSENEQNAKSLKYAEKFFIKSLLICKE